MTIDALLKVVVFLLLVLGVTRPIGTYLKKVFAREATLLDPLLLPVERLLHRLAGVDPRREQGWKAYTVAMLVLNGAGIVLLYALQRLQGVLPANPDRLAGVAPLLAWSTAVSFVTNTNWQAYAGEATMSHLTQAAGLAVQNFLSAATGLALAVAVIRGATRAESGTIGNFWADLVRGTLWVLLPASLVAGTFFVSQGVVQDFGATREFRTLEGALLRVPQGPVASQEAIKVIGTNGGGFFNANSAHPYENPTPATNLVQMLLIFAIPAGLTRTLGEMTGKPGHGWAVFGAMAVLFLSATLLAAWAEGRGNPIHQALGVDRAGGNMEGKEVRFGAADSALFASVTTSASCGAVNAMHDSLTPLAGLVTLLNIQLGEVVFGGVGAGLYGIFVFIVLAVFIAGLMVGRTPEYLGKKIEAHEVKLAMLSVLALTFCILGGTAAGVSTKAGRAGISNAGPHGLSQVLYAFTSAAGNNGSAFAGLDASSDFYNAGLATAMFLGRFWMVVPILAIAGALSAKKRVAETSGTFPVEGPLFVTLLVGVILVVGALTYFPALALGPVVEQIQMLSGRLS